MSPALGSGTAAEGSAIGSKGECLLRMESAQDVCIVQEKETFEAERCDVDKETKAKKKTEHSQSKIAQHNYTCVLLDKLKGYISKISLLIIFVYPSTYETQNPKS